MRRIAALTTLVLSACVTTPAPPLPDRSLAAFEAALSAQNSATATLAEWCALHGIASPARITARPAGGSGADPEVGTQNVRAALEVSGDEVLGYRHVLLSCGDIVLSDAHNWYVPGRLTAEANQLLNNTDTPFGRAVGPANFNRERMAEARGAAEQCPSDTVLSHLALLRGRDERPISMVVECYTPANLSGATAE